MNGIPQLENFRIPDLRGRDPAVFFDSVSAGKNGNEAPLLFTDPVDQVIAVRDTDVPAALARIDRLSSEFWLAGYMDYSALKAGSGVGSGRSRTKNDLPLLWFGVYEKPLMVRKVDRRDCFPAQMNIQTRMDFAEYERAILAIKQFIKEGETYQVNYTFDFQVCAQAGAEHLYGFLREFQKTPYCAFLRGGGREVLSFSPELFFERDGDHICVQPMKGTAARGALAGLDEERSQLAADEKNRAENVMIVDLLRNDLGRIAKTGSVRVESLFDVETHPTLHQMTSRIRAELGPEVTYQKIFEAIFPSGSVTGAPKVRTMQIIDGLERGGRGVYCGAIGYISPQKKAVFSVPIRILQRAAGETDWQYRVGSGIVWDSDPRSEWEEAHLKTKFLTQGAPKDFQLIETMLWENGRLLWRDEHLKRLEASARCFGFSMDGGILEKLEEFLRQLPGASQRVRLLCSRDGTIELQASLLAAWAREREVLVGVSEVRLDPENIFLRHKTTCRPWYQMTMERIAGKDVFDDVFFNSKGQLCEGAITNVFVEINGCLYTPPVECGLLPGILRQQLLKEGRCRERLISREEFFGAQRFYVGNSVRGLLPARLKEAERR